MSVKAKRAGSGLLLTLGAGVNFSAIIALAYSQGQKDAQTQEKISTMEIRQAEGSVDRDRMNNKLDVLLKAVARIEGRLKIQ